MWILAKDGFTSSVKTPQKNKFQRNTQQNNNTCLCKTNMRSLKVLLQFQYEKKTEKRRRNKKKIEDNRITKRKKMKMQRKNKWRWKASVMN